MIKANDTYKPLIIKPICILILLFCNSQISLAQNPVIENIIEELASSSELEGVDYSTFVDDLNFYLENPLNLNEVDAEKLEQLHFLNESQINNLLNYITLREGMETIYELQLIDGFNQITIEKMLPFITLVKVNKTENLDFDKVFKYGRHKLIAETNFALQTPKVYQSSNDGSKSHYKGNKMMYKLKYKFHYKNKMFFGLSAEKDQGESFNFTEQPYGFDFYSAHFQINKIGKFKQINVGDFHAQFGQGLIMNTGFSLGKSSDVMNIRKRAKALRYYSSTNENNFLRGIGATIMIGKLKLSSFISYKKIDATIANSDTSENSIDKFISRRYSGYHRTETEIKNRKVLGELIAGSKLSCDFRNLKLAFNFVGYKYEKAIESEPKPYKLYDLKDDYNLNSSLDYYYYYKRMSFFGEFATDKDLDIATINGFTMSLASQLSFSLLHRYYQKDYNAQYSNSFGENSHVCNEQGMYYGLEFYPFSKLKLSAYADIFRFNWLRYRVDAPSNGYEYLLNLNYAINRYVAIDLKYKSTLKAININNEHVSLKMPEDIKTEHYRFHIGYKLSKSISLSNRIEVSLFEQNNTKQYGYLLYQDAHFLLTKLPISFYLRYSVFDAGYNNRIYAYENDLFQNFSVPTFSGKGSSFYIVCNYDLASFLSIRIKYRQSFYPANKTIGSGLSAINGNIKSYLKLQLIAKL